MMKRTRIQKVAHGGRLVAAAIVAVACIRFAAVAVETAMAEDQKPPTAAPPAPSSGRVRAPGSAQPAPTTQPDKPPSPPGAPIKVQLLVNVGTERSEVYVDGAKIGSSPYVGTISCRTGDKLDIEVVITKGVVYGYERTCEPGTIRVDAAP